MPFHLVPVPQKSWSAKFTRQKYRQSLQIQKNLTSIGSYTTKSVILVVHASK